MQESDGRKPDWLGFNSILQQEVITFIEDYFLKIFAKDG